ncbi:GntR family transcriptional regulator [Tianweitania sp. BSSL-BM11]|uniref:GntR family transcriptional regulator n=1 Tax=Tianweitania aestuarii TaxID=2814886 RepID=A0ABS5RXR5_9HYPH|nr:GntR family transcriptional regulator [Tianweitania aestuarii]MBS9721836.1 GntR family transcriptional regulator [Tianweitania aestuarii]
MLTSPSKNRVDSAGLRAVKKRSTTQDLVYEQLRDALIAGMFEAGHGFTVAALADQFGTSHMPVREALRRLAAENALSIGTSGTAMVPLTSAAGLDHLGQARCILEGTAARLAAELISDEAVKKLKATAAIHVEALRDGASGQMLASNRAFHFAIYEAAGNPVMVNLIENLWLQYGPYVRLLSDRMTDLLRSDIGGQYSKHHVDVLSALCRRDSQAAEQALIADIKATQALVCKFC